MAETLGSIVDLVQSQLAGFTADIPLYGTLTGGITDSDTELVLDMPSQSEPAGLIEIDSELIHIGEYDADTGIATVPAWGRGQLGTTPVAHDANSRVTVNPRYPRGRVAFQINQVIAGICPPLFAVATGSIDTEVLTYEYALPAGTRNLIEVKWRPYDDPSYDWMPVRSASVRRHGGTPTLHLPSSYGYHSGSKVHYIVAKNPTSLADEADLFTASGLAESAIDVVVVGACLRLVSSSELQRQQLQSVETSERAILVPATSGTTLGRYLRQEFQIRLDQEAARLRQEYPIRMMRTND
jgi:hypothetical protein